MEETRVAVVGGGFAGLFTALELTALGVECVVLDANTAPGGVARTIVRDGYELEPGAGSLLLPHPDLSRSLDLAGVVPEPAVDGGTRWVRTRGRLVELPASPKALVAPIAPWRHKMRAAMEPFVPRGDDADEAVGAFLRRRLGRGLGSTLAWVAASGVFAGDPERLAIRSAFPVFAELEDEGGSIVRGAIRRRRAATGPRRGRPRSHVPPPGGMAGVADAIVGVLADRYRPGVNVEAIRPDGGRWIIDGPEQYVADRVVLATRPGVAGRLLGGALEDAIGTPPTAPVVVVGVGGPIDDVPLPKGFGALVGPDVGTAILGVLFESSYAPHRAPEGHALAKVIAGGATRPEVVSWDDDVLRRTIVEEVERILGVAVSPTVVEIVRHPEGIPQYDVGHGEWVRGVEAVLPPGVHLTGWGYRGVGVAHLATDARRVAEAIANRY